MSLPEHPTLSLLAEVCHVCSPVSLPSIRSSSKLLGSPPAVSLQNPLDQTDKTKERYLIIIVLANEFDQKRDKNKKL